MSLVAFNNDPIIEVFYRNRVAEHVAHGLYEPFFRWNSGRGNLIGAAVHSDDLDKFTKELGIPRWVAILAEYIQRKLSAGKAVEWTKTFLDSIKRGADLDKVRNPFLAYFLACPFTMEMYVLNPLNMHAVRKLMQSGGGSLDQWHLLLGLLQEQIKRAGQRGSLLEADALECISAVVSNLHNLAFAASKSQADENFDQVPYLNSADEAVVHTLRCAVKVWTSDKRFLSAIASKHLDAAERQECVWEFAAEIFLLFLKSAPISSSSNSNV